MSNPVTIDAYGDEVEVEKLADLVVPLSSSGYTPEDMEKAVLYFHKVWALSEK
jgi:hypothetical protein